MSVHTHTVFEVGGTGTGTLFCEALVGQRNLRHRIESLQLPTNSSLRLGVVSDSHGRPHTSATELLRRLEVDVILHAGDVGRIEVLDELKSVAPTIAVRGNMDSQQSGLFDVITVEFIKESTVRLRLLLIHAAIARAKLTRHIRELAYLRRAQLVICGHSHIPFVGTDGDIAVFNPGSYGPRRFHLPITIGVVSVAVEGVQFEHWDCETRKRWLPRVL